jgi:hypothetical protein
LVQLLSELRVPIAGSTTLVAHKALARAIGDPRLVVLLAECGDLVHGVSLGVIDPKRFWKDIAVRNPQLLALRLLSIVKRRMRKRPSSGEESVPALTILLDSPTGRHWGESSPDIGQVTLVLLRPELRGSGMSVPFMSALLDELARRGARRVDARIARGNIPSIRMCKRLGMTVEDTGANVFATGDLAVPRGDV